MADTFKVTTAALNGVVNDKLEPLADQIHRDPNVAEIVGYSTATESPLKAGHGDSFAPAKDLFTQLTAFSKRMSDNTDGIKKETTQLARNVKDVGEHFHATDQNAQWTVDQVQGLFFNLETDSSSTPGAGPGPGPAVT